MDYPTVIVKALAAGAAASLRPNVFGTLHYQTPVMSAYNELKESLAEQLPRVSVDLLDIGPASEARQEMLLEQLREAEKPIPDALIERAHQLLELCAKESPESLLAAGLRAQALTLLDWPTPFTDRPPLDNEVQLMQINLGTNVFTADGEHVGDVNRVVLDPDSKEVTHIIVEKGFLFTDDKVVPISLVGGTSDVQVKLRPNAGDLDEFPNFEETHYISAEQPDRPAQKPTYAARTLYWYPPVGYWQNYGGYISYPLSPYVTSEERNIPDGTVALKEGAAIIDRNGEHVGNLERLYTDPAADRATHLLISEGLIFKDRRLVPTDWINHVMEDEIHLSVDAELVEKVPEYESQA